MYTNLATPTGFDKATPGLVAILNNRPDWERACAEHWYRIPVRTAPPSLPECRWLAFYFTAAFGADKWAVRYWAEVQALAQVRRVELLPAEADHPRAEDWYYRLSLGPIQDRPEPIFSRRRRRIVFIPSVWQRFRSALEINDLHHGSPLEDRLWAAFKQEGIDAERQWFEGTRKRLYCLDFAVFCQERNIDVECDGDTWHANPEQARRDNLRNNFLEQRGWHVLRFNSAQLNVELDSCLDAVKGMIWRCGGLTPLENGRSPLPPLPSKYLGDADQVLPPCPTREPENPCPPPVPKAEPEKPPDVQTLLLLARKEKRKAMLMRLQATRGTEVLARELSKALQAFASRVRARAVCCLGELERHSVVLEALATCLAKEKSRNVRRQAYAACAKLGASELEDAILEKLSEEKDHVLQSALKALARCGGQKAVPVIQAILQNRQPAGVVKAAEGAIQQCTRWW